MSEIAKTTKSLANFLNTPKTAKFLEDTLRENKNSFVSALIALSNDDPKLLECNPADLMKCAMNAVSLNLPINKNFGQAYVIAYGGKPQFQIGARGFKQLAIRSGQYKAINQVEIREGELNFNKFTGEFDFNKENPEGKIVGYLAYFELLNGYRKALYMTNEQLEAHAKKYSKSYQYDLKKGYNGSKWSTDERHFMCLKTVVKLLLSREGVLSVEMANAIDKVDNDETFDKMPEDKNKDIQEAEIIEQKEEEPGQFQM